MPDIRIVLSALWVATMLIYLLGDVLRIFSYDFPKTMDTAHFTRKMWLGISMMMSIPIIMMLVPILIEDYAIVRWSNIIAAGFFFIFTLVSVHTYPSAYDRFLLLVSMGFNALVIWYAWNWTPVEVAISAITTLN